jgi:mono/diheme cytochrome c family protein
MASERVSPSYSTQSNSTKALFATWIACFLMIGFGMSVEAADANTPALPAQPQAFLTQHCQTCHSGDKPKGKFHLNSLATDFDSRANRERWLQVLEQVKSGIMPPADQPRPTAQEIQAIAKWIGDRVAAAENARSSSQGRVVLRRLNRAEYANTVRDLLDVNVDLKDLLPLDTSTNGFDNSAESLHVSSYLMENYLEAADRVIDAAIASGPRPQTLKRKFDIREERTVKPTGSVYRHTDDGVAIFSSWVSANIQVTLWNFRSRERGQYRFRISGYGYQSNAKPVNFHVVAGTLTAVTEERLIDYFTVPADKPTVIEFVEQLEAKNCIRIVADGLGALPPEVQKIGAENYKGPGLVVQWVEIEGPLLDSWPPRSHRQIFGDLPQEPSPKADSPNRREVVSKEPLADAERILRSFTQRAFRRAVTDDEVKPFVARVKAKLDQGDSFEQAMRVGLKAVLVSPHFLFLREKVGPASRAGLHVTTSAKGNGTDDSKSDPAASPARLAGPTSDSPKGTPLLDDFALASRLSYFLWSSMPDDELFQLAAAGQLSEPKVLRQQVERMLSDPKAKAFTENFAGQWLGLRAIDSTMPDRMLYPEYDDILKVSMVKEALLFFDEVLRNDLSLTNFVASDFTMLNGRLAKLYGIPGIEGLDFHKVSLPAGSHRGGVMTMAAVLKVTANGTTTSPILRGAWVLDRILGTPPPKPTVDVEAVEPDIRGATTIREQLAKHRQVGECASCHKQIDPPGFALENFDVIGGWREHYRKLNEGEPVVINGRRVRYLNGPPVDAADVLPDGRKFRDIDEYKQLLLDDKDQLARALAEKLLSYATGAAPTVADQPAVEAIVSNVRGLNYGFRSLIHEVVQSAVFRSK